MDVEGEEAEDEAEVPREARVPSEPTDEERKRHETTHLPFRAWCPYCVRGKSKATAHRRIDKQEGQIPIVAIYYMYKETADKEAEQGMPILAMKDSESKWVRAPRWCRARASAATR